MLDALLALALFYHKKVFLLRKTLLAAYKQKKTTMNKELPTKKDTSIERLNRIR